ncbi:hypothetical protein, partial [Helicobacter sp. 13S00477-4]|uniref:hypothetical protein n=1 Tax=Helicobacter sp. 13S00477-4 TaxID=1905759 RepID=UPI00117BDEC8
MKIYKKIFYFLSIYIPIFSYSVTGTIVQLQPNYNSNATINEDFTFQATDRLPILFTGIMFNGYTTMNIDPNATVTVNVSTQGNYEGYSGAIFRGQNGSNYVINGGTIVFNVKQIQKIGQGIEGMFMGQAMNYGKNADFDFNTNFYLIASPDVYIQRGVFTSNGHNAGYFKFTKNVFIDVSEMQPSEGWGAAKNGKGYRMIFSLEGDGAVYINYNEATRTTLDKSNIIQLKGDLSAESTSRGNININLDNPQSFFQGRISLAPGSTSNIELYLNHGGKWILNANSQITTLDTNNEDEIIQNLYTSTSKLAVVDFTRIADDGLSYRLISPTPFASRTLNVNTINGNNGVFRLMADVDRGLIDTIRA